MKSMHWLLLVGVFGCSSSGPSTNPAGEDHNQDAGINSGDPTDAAVVDPWNDRLGDRKKNYGAALRSAALRLTGDLPTLAEIKAVTDASDVATAYRTQLETYMNDPRFAGQMVEFWRDTLKMGESQELDSAPVFAAQITVEGRPYTELLTASAGTCPTFNAANGTFAAGNCNNNAPVTAGLLSHPAVQKQFFSNLAFRRVRWVQEIFACTAYPAEVVAPQDVGGASAYTAPWPFASISGAGNGGDIDFLDTSAVTCANCHATMNHLAPLFANFDDQGNYQNSVQVRKPTEGTPLAALSDWLPTGETTAWRFGAPASDLAALGQVMAADPLISECAVARTWNWAFGKADIVDTLSVVPSETIASHVAEFESSGFKLKQIILSVLTSDDFTSF